MPETVTPYIERHPRDLITAEDWNHVQMLIKKDIEERLKEAIADINLVPKSGDSAKLAGKTPEELAKDIIDSALQEVNKRTGYMRIFRKLQVTEPDAPDKDVKVSLIEHGLKDFPVTDVYQLEFFEVICSEDDVKEKEEVLFYLYHSSEKKIKTRDPNNQPVEAEIEPAGDAVFKIPFAKMLELYKVPYDGDTTLGDLETEFWEAFYAKPNDEFDDDEDCHSPWFDRCCGEKRTVNELKKRGDWDEIWFKTKPVKTVNVNQPDDDTAGDRRPAHVRVEQYDFDQLGLIYRPPAPANAEDENPPLPVMVLLKV